jgi:hypothetical protein
LPNATEIILKNTTVIKNISVFFSAVRSDLTDILDYRYLTNFVQTKDKLIAANTTDIITSFPNHDISISSNIEDCREWDEKYMCPRWFKPTDSNVIFF